MSRLFAPWCVVLVLLAGSTYASQQVEDLRAEVDKLRAEIGKQEAPAQAPIGQADSLCDCHFGPNEKVTTKDGKLTFGMLTQIWYQHIEKDPTGLVAMAPGNSIPNAEPNSLNDNDTFRVRRTEMRFNLDVSDYINAYIMMDPSRENNITYTPLPTFPLHNTILTNSRLVDGGGRGIPSLLQDAYINFHGFVPHHDFTVGQFKPPSGEEAWRNSGQLDFADRAMVTSINNVRDIGVMVHGSFIDNRVQYWAGMFNGAAGTVLNDPEIVEGGNRPSTQQAKNFCERLSVNPVWSTEKWYGRLQVGGARTDGRNGDVGQGTDLNSPGGTLNGLDRERTSVDRNAAWLWYRPNGIMKGAWFRYEYGSERDRYDPLFRTSLLNITNGVSPFLGNLTLPSIVVYPNGNAFSSSGQALPKPVTVEGFYAATGYKLSDSIFAKQLKDGCWIEKYLHDMEFCFRFEQFDNVAAESLVNPDRDTDLFHTTAFWGGINYYFKGYESRLQMNYIAVRDPVNKLRGLRDFQNNVFVLTYQIMF